MICARGESPEGAKSVLMILEPGNIEKLRLFQPIVKKLNEFIPELPFEVELVIGFTPDAPFVSGLITRGVGLAEALKRSVAREEVFPVAHDPESMVRFPLDGNGIEGKGSAR